MQIKNLYSFVSTLSGVNRFSMLKLVHKENCLEHTGMIAIFAYTIAEQINARILKETAKDRNAVQLLDTGTVLLKAVVHDFDEAVTGDVVRPTKYFSTALRDEMKKLELHGIERIATKLDLPNLIEQHFDSKDLEDRHGYIVAFADFMCAVHRLWEEVLCFNNTQMAHCAAHMHNALYNLNIKRPAAHMAFQKVLDEYYEEMNAILMLVRSTKQNEFVEMAAK